MTNAIINSASAPTVTVTRTFGIPIVPVVCILLALVVVYFLWALVRKN